jgi:alpha-beta hydrolase superfamily lysophospholipase
VARWLGSPEAPLFAWLDAPDDGMIAGAAVLCPSLGLEATYSARALRDLAHRLAAAGWAALRFDYTGTGDSAGNWTDPDLVDAWLESVRLAVAEARTLGSPRVAVVGLRAGTTLAAAALATAPVDDLVLWDPCATGKSFLREQRALAVFRREQAIEWGGGDEGMAVNTGEPFADGSLETPGIVFSAATMAALEPLTLAPGASRPAARELILGRAGRRLPRALAERSEQPQVEVADIEGQEALLEVEAITPDATLDHIVRWVTARGGPPVAMAEPEPRVTARLRGEDGSVVVEQPLQLGPARLFGMRSEPEGTAEAGAATVVLLNVGRMGHAGPARFWVELARALAAAGVRCVRVDLNGLGESPTRPGRTELVEFPADAVQDLGDIRQALAAEGSPLAFVGLCSGADHAIEGALEGMVAAVCVINPALNFVRWGQHPYRRYEPNEEVQLSSDRDSWGSTRPLVSRAMKRLAPFRDMTRRLPNVGWWVVNRWFITSSPAKTLERVTESDVDVLLVAGVPEAHRMYRGEHRRIRSLVRRGRFRMEVVPNLEHSLLERTGRARVGELLLGYLTALGRPGGDRPGA